MDYIPGFYSETGRPAQNQAQILRSLILFVLLFNKTPGDDGKLEDNDTAVTCKDIVSDIIGGRPVSDNPEAAHPYAA